MGSSPRIVASRPPRPRGRAAAFVLLLAAAVAKAGDAAPPWCLLPSGLEARSITAVASPDLPVEAWLLRLDPRRHQLRVVLGAQPSGAVTTPRVAPVLAEECGALAMLNASYFDSGGRPLGLLVRDGHVLQAVNGRGWAWAGLLDDALVVRDASLPVPAGLSQAVQAGPRLVAGGVARRLTSVKRARRAFVGADRQGRVVLGATNGPVTLGELARLLAREESAGGAGLERALNLDGGSSTQLYIAGASPPLKVAGVPVPVFLGVFPSPTPARAP